MSRPIESLSKYLSLVLRHRPEEIGLALDQYGWTEIDHLVAMATSRGTPITRDLVLEIAATSDKKRFAISPDGNRIRANQGHSIAVNLNLTPREPPSELFHGTAMRFEQSIREKGLLPGSRQHVHLSSDTTTATKVGARHGKPMVLIVRASDMHRDGHEFMLTDNAVWLACIVPPHYIEFPSQA
jgi:putative RNA 2'-phosphotransferase